MGTTGTEPILDQVVIARNGAVEGADVIRSIPSNNAVTNGDRSSNADTAACLETVPCSVARDRNALEVRSAVEASDRSTLLCLVVEEGAVVDIHHDGRIVVGENRASRSATARIGAVVVKGASVEGGRSSGSDKATAAA